MSVGCSDEAMQVSFPVPHDGICAGTLLLHGLEHALLDGLRKRLLDGVDASPGVYADLFLDLSPCLRRRSDGGENVVHGELSGRIGSIPQSAGIERFVNLKDRVVPAKNHRLNGREVAHGAFQDEAFVLLTQVAGISGRAQCTVYPRQ